MCKFLIWLLWTCVAGMATASSVFLWWAVEQGEPTRSVQGAGALAGCGGLAWLASKFSRRKWHSPPTRNGLADEVFDQAKRPTAKGCVSYAVGWILFFGAGLLLVAGGYAIALAVEHPSVAFIQAGVLMLLLSAVFGWLWYITSRDFRRNMLLGPMELPVNPPAGSEELPPASTPPVYYLLTILALPFASLYLANHVASGGDLLREADPRQFVITLVACLMVPAVLLVVHELGHLLMAWALGFRPVEFNLGSGKPWFQRRIGNLDLVLRFRVQQGMVIALPMKEDGFRWKQFWIFAAGPLAEAVALIICIVLALQHRPDPERWFAGLVGCILLAHLLHSRHPRQMPMDNELVYNDAHWMRHYWSTDSVDVRDEMAGQWAGWIMRLWNKRQDRAKAWELLAESELLMPNQPKLLHVKSYCLAEEARWDEAATVVNSHLQLASSDSQEERSSLIGRWAYFTVQSGNFDAARLEWDGLLASLADDASRVNALDFFATLALESRKHGEPMFAEAISAIERAILLQPDSITLQGTKGSLLVEMNREAEAEPILTKVLNETTSDTDRAICAIYLGIIAKRQDNIERQRHYETLGTQNPAYQTISWLAERAKEITESL
jgi:hypothetical protein